MITITVYAAIRKCVETGEEFVDTGSVSCSQKITGQNVAEADELLPDWARIYPVQRITRMCLTEEK